MTRKETQIITDPSLMPYPFTFNKVITGQGYEVTVTFPTEPDEAEALLAQAATDNPAQVAAAQAAGNP
jgi:hypothetical protein